MVLIHLESVRARSVTPYNSDLQTMPYLAELARGSLLVERAYTTTPHTSKAVTSANSGLHPCPDTEIVEAQPGGIPARCLHDLLQFFLCICPALESCCVLGQFLFLNID